MFAHQMNSGQWEIQAREYRRQEYEIESWLKMSDAETIHKVFEEVTGGSDKAIELYDRAFKAVLEGKTFDMREEVLVMLMDDYRTWEKAAYK